jgi:maltose/moltooligosaccharide transporter
VGGIVFFLAVLWTVLFSKEYSPDELEAFEKNKDLPKIEPKTEQEIQRNISTQKTSGWMMILTGGLVSYFIYLKALTKELYILFVGLIIVGVLFLIVSELRKKRIRNGFTIIVSDLLNMPKTMKQLAWVQFFSWFALFSMWIYTTQAVTGHVFDTRDTTSKLYNDAADWVTVMFTVYNGVAAIVAFALPVLAKKTSNKFTHMLALSLGGLGLISIYFVSSKLGLILCMVGVGIAWASILSIPYAMLSGSLPSSKMGYFMGVFNFFIVIPQIVASTILGFIVSNLFDNQPVYALIIGGIAMILAGLFTLKVTTNSRIDLNQTND